MKSGTMVAVLAMTIVIVASNFLVQFPVGGEIGGIQLADLLTWGAFTFPIAYLVTDITNRRFGAGEARKLTYVGFAVAALISWQLATPRIAIASGSAFLIAQLIDVSIFDRLRRASWWQAPIISSTVGSIIDTLLFFGIAFSLAFAFLGDDTGFANETAPFVGVGGFETARWISWAFGDLTVKLLVAVAMLVPYRIVSQILLPSQAHA